MAAHATAGEAPEAATPEAAIEGEPVYHKIVPRDTLWDISEKYLKDPFKWPGVWKNNPYIKNPHLIYPGNIVRITPDGIEVMEPADAKAEGLDKVTLEEPPEKVELLEPEAEEVKAPEAPAGPKLKDHAIARSGFISVEDLKGSGAIAATKEKNNYFGDGEDVFLTFKDKASVNAGDRYTIFAAGRRIKHPETGKGLGYEIDVLGSVIVTKVADVVEGTVDRVYHEVPVGAKLRPYSAPVLEVAITEADTDVAGVIVTALEGKENLSSGDVVYIDKGSRDGLKPGNMMRVYRAVPKVPDPMNGKEIQLPPLELGSLVVIETSDGASTAVLVKSTRAIVWGDGVSTLRTE